jgi:hypothetical protein
MGGLAAEAWLMGSPGVGAVGRRIRGILRGA